MRILGGLLVLSILAGTGCDTLNPQGCIALAAAGGFRVTIKDSVTSAPLAFGAAASATDETTNAVYLFPAAAASTDTALLLFQGSPSGSGSNLYEGRYTLRVERSGYRAWARSGLQLELGPGPCRPLSFIDVTARLVP